MEPAERLGELGPFAGRGRHQELVGFHVEIVEDLGLHAADRTELGGDALVHLQEGAAAALRDPGLEEAFDRGDGVGARAGVRRHLAGATGGRRSLSRPPSMRSCASARR